MQVCSVTPLGLLVGALMPKAVGLEPLEATTPTKINALLLTYTMIAAAAFLAIVGLMCVATTALHHAAVEATMQELRERSSPSVMMNTRADGDSEEGRSDERAQEHHVDVGEYDNTENVVATDVLPQIARLASSAEFICIAAAFALSVSPLQLFFNFQELIVDSHGFFNTPADKIIVVVVAVAGAPPYLLHAHVPTATCSAWANAALSDPFVFLVSFAMYAIGHLATGCQRAVFLLPALLHTVYRLRAVRHLDVIGLQLALLGIMIVCANFIVGGVTARDTGTHAMLATTAVLAAALMALLLERSIGAAQRNRPAVAAGTVWLATHSLTVLYSGMSEGMRCPSEEGGLGKGHRSGVCTFDRVKWLAVCSFAAAFVAAVLSLLLSSRCGFSCPAPASLVQAAIMHESAHSVGRGWYQAVKSLLLSVQ